VSSTTLPTQQQRIAKCYHGNFIIQELLLLTQLPQEWLLFFLTLVILPAVALFLIVKALDIASISPGRWKEPGS
jgi:hypothetical protein